MNTADQLPPTDPHQSPLDDQLRAAFDFLSTAPSAAPEKLPDFPAPPPHLWAGVEAGLRPAPVPIRRAPLMSGVSGLVLGILLMWGWEHGIPGRRPAMVKERPAMVEERAATVKERPAMIEERPAMVEERPATPPELARHSVGQVAIQTSELPAMPLLPVLLPLVQAETTYAALPAADSAADTRATRRAALLTERTALLALVRRADSLLRPLGVLPEVPIALAVPADPTAPDSAAPGPAFRRWSVAVAFAPERNFFGLTAPATDSLTALRRTHEQGRGGWNASLGAEYRLTHRWSVGAGLGWATTGAELRLTDRRTNVAVRYDTVTTTTTQVSATSNTVYSVRLNYLIQLSPRFNGDGQVVSYDTLRIPRPDTTFITTRQTDTLQTTTRALAAVESRRETLSHQTLRPTYHFLTLPLVVRYRLGRAQDWTSAPTAPRWWADVAVGAQLQWFMGGTQLATTDGRTYRTERVGRSAAPFRALNVALTGAVAANYALTPRLAVSLAPTVRWQVQSVYRTGTGLRQRPTSAGVQAGVRWSF